jgi:two-component system, NtrC family, sensor histidine kinase GlrK
MRIGYPTSFLKLLLFGFAFAILPLIVAFINANLAFNHLTAQSQTTITDAVHTTRASHVLQEQLHLMERSARQYFVLHDKELLALYHQSRAVLNEAILTLERYAREPKQRTRLMALKADEAQLYQQITNTTDLTEPNPAFLDTFRALSQQATQVIQENNRVIDTNSSLLVSESRAAQQRFFMQSLVLIPLALLVAGLIAYMIGRPIQRMDNAIARLGKGEYQTPITIHGPGNLSVLGQRLDWLRLELLQLKAQKQQFLQHISHELKTPLTAIREAAELLSDGVGGQLSQQQQEITLILKENSVRLQKMIENLLTFTRMEAGKLILNTQTTSISALMQSVLDAHALTIRNKQIHIQQDYALRMVTADSDKLLTILDNLISNAIKFTPPQGEVKLSSKAEKHWQVLEVIDNGPGLREEDKSKLFDPFYQGKTVHQGLVGSSGLGLAVAKDLVEAHRGTIELIDTPVGAHFIVRLPKMELV